MTQQTRASNRECACRQRHPSSRMRSFSPARPRARLDIFRSGTTLGLIAAGGALLAPKCPLCLLAALSLCGLGGAAAGFASSGLVALGVLALYWRARRRAH